MPTKPKNLEQLITDHAASIASDLEDATDRAETEEDLRHEFNKYIDDFLEDAELEIRGRHEYSIAGGRVDSKYAGVLIEYKAPTSRAQLGNSPDHRQTAKVIDQLKSRFEAFSDEKEIDPKRLFGVGTDGRKLVVVTYTGDRYLVDGPVNVTAFSIERLLRALVSVGAHGKSFTPKGLAESFGAASDTATKAVKTLYRVLEDTSDDKTLTFFRQWKILFGEVCSFDVDRQTSKVSVLGQQYGIKSVDEPAKLFFAIHTYYAIFTRLLAAEIVSSFSPLAVSTIRKCVAAESASELKTNIEELERGGIWTDLGIHNFLEGDLFSWYTAAWDDRIASVVRSLVRELDRFDPGTLSVDITESRDLLKRLYQRLFPKEVRHDLGEYYTPDWLAEYVFEDISFDGNPDHKVLDPACGSGTFLVGAINRAKAWYSRNQFDCGYGKTGLIDRIQNNFIGFDLNPLAVLTARTNFLLAIRDLIRQTDRVEIPIYLCDAVMTPEEYGGLFAGGKLGGAKKLSTAVGEFLIPTEVASDRELLSRYAETIELAVSEEYTGDELLKLCDQRGLDVGDESVNEELLRRLQELQSEDRNGIWVRIIKNAFAPLFIGDVDYVIGNPPWIFWNNLPANYREDVRQLMTDGYAIMSDSASTMEELGAVGKDISMLFFYVALDRYLKSDGELGFVITQTLFQSKAGYEFRKFSLPDQTPIKVSKVADWVKVEPFRQWASNRTAVVFAEIGEPTDYPVAYPTYTPVEPFDRADADLKEVFQACAKQDLAASPSNKNDNQSAWSIQSGDTRIKIGVTEKEQARHKARRGVEAIPVSVFRINVLGESGRDEVIVENDTRWAKKPVKTQKTAIEKGLLRRYVAGRHFKRWHADSDAYYITPHTESTGMSPISIGQMKSKFPKTLAFLSEYREELEDRYTYKSWGGDKPFYSLFGVGPYTFSAYLVAWPRKVTDNFKCAVLEPIEDEIIGKKQLLPNGAIMFVPFEDEEKAYFLAALINSSYGRLQIQSSVGGNAGDDTLDALPIPRFDAANDSHLELVDASLEAHSAASSDDTERLRKVEHRVDQLSADIWGIDRAALEKIRSAAG